MRIRPFEYVAPGGLEAVLAELRRHGPDARVLAGGTDLVLNLKKKAALPRRVVSLHRVRELDQVRRDSLTVRIGALVCHADLADHPALREEFPGLCEASSLIGSWQIRNVGTIGGNLCNASPAADTAPALLALGARVVLADASGEEELPLADFFAGPGQTVLRPDQLLREVVLDRPKARSAGRYLKLRRRRAVDVSLAGVAFQAELDSQGERLSRVAVALGGVAPTPIRVPAAEEPLRGRTRDECLAALPAGAAAAVAAMRPITDVRASADYRRAIVGAYVRRAAQAVLDDLFPGGGKPA